MPLSFDTELLGPLKLERCRKEDAGPGGAQAALHALAARGASAKLTVCDGHRREGLRRRGALQGRGRGHAARGDAGRPSEGKVMSISLQAYDTSDFYTERGPLPVAGGHPPRGGELPLGQRGHPGRRASASWTRACEAHLGGGDALRRRRARCGSTCWATRTRWGPRTPTASCRSSGRAASPRTSASAALRVPIFYEGFGEQAPRKVDAGRDRRARQPPRRVHHRGGGSDADERSLLSAVATSCECLPGGTDG